MRLCINSKNFILVMNFIFYMGFRQTIELVNRLSEPQPGSKELRFPTRYPQSSMEQYLACLWKQHLSYWRSPEYNMARFVFMIFAALLFGAVVWQKGKEM